MILNIMLASIEPMMVLLIVLMTVVFIAVIAIIKSYKRCPSDKILVVYGYVGKNKTSKIIHGGAAFVLPIIQDYEFLDLTPIPVTVDLRNALSSQNIRVNVPSRFMVAISTEEGVIQNAADRLLGISDTAIHDLAADIIFGQLRIVISHMTIDDIINDRIKFTEILFSALGQKLKKIGLKIIDINITDITDDSGYIEALIKKSTEDGINKLKK